MAERYVENPSLLLVPRLGYYSSDAQELIQKTRGTFRTSGICSVSDVLLILASQSVVFTTEEAMSFFRGSRRTIEDSIAVLKGGLRKNGAVYIEKGSFGFRQGQSRDFYYLTDKGLAQASVLLNGHYFNARAAGFSESKAVHTYGTGINVYQAFLAGFPFRTRREAPPKAQKYTDDDKLYTDVVIYAYPSETDRTSRIFVEEDTGSEKRDILIDKLRKYASYDLMTEKRDCILFSFIVPRACSYTYRGTKMRGLDAVVFNEKELTPLLLGMEKSETGDAYQFYTEVATEHSRMVEDFLLSVHAAGKEGGRLTRGAVTVSADFIRAYLLSSKSFQNPYVMNGINRIYQTASDENLRLFAESFAILSENNEAFLRAVAGGFQVYCAATTLSCDAMRFSLLSVDTELQGIISRTFGDGFSYERMLFPVSPNRRSPIMLRNLFSDGNGKKFCFEPACFDAGAWYRLWLVLKSGLHLTCPLILMFYDLSEADSFFSFTVVKDGSAEGVYGILYRDLVKRGRLFYPVKGDGGIEYYRADDL